MTLTVLPRSPANILRILPALALLALAAPVTVQGAKNDREQLPPEIVALVEAKVHEEMAKNSVPGLTVAIAWEGQIRYSKAFGLADIENQVPARTDTRFRTASIAKSLTATAVMKLVELGLIDLDADIREYVPAFPQQDKEILVRHVLSHQSGIRHYDDWSEAVGTVSYADLEQTLRIFAKDELVQVPGAAFHYTTFGYTLLGLAIEAVTGETYEAAMQQLVWEPADMTYTGIDHHFEVIPNRARGYARLESQDDIPIGMRGRVQVGDLIRAELHDTSMKVPGGGMVSTAEDLARFGLAMLEERLVSHATRELMWTAARDASEAETPYGMGWWMNAGNITHGGGQAGTTCMLAIRESNGVVVAMMSNLQRPNNVPFLAESLTELMGR